MTPDRPRPERRAPPRPTVAGVRLGDDRPFDDALRASLVRNISTFEVRRSDDPALKPAAVCVCVVDDGDGRAAVLLTLRTRSLHRHGNQYALPGGRLDAGESDEEAALRELDEELGLALAPASVLGRLDDFETVSGYRIAPMVVWGGAAPDLRPAPDEVARVFRIPFRELLSPDIPHIGPDAASGDDVFSAPLPTLGHHLFAPTAAILYQFREVAVLGNAVRVAGAGQPGFARR